MNEKNLNKNLGFYLGYGHLKHRNWNTDRERERKFSLLGSLRIYKLANVKARKREYGSYTSTGKVEVVIMSFFLPLCNGCGENLCVCKCEMWR